MYILGMTGPIGHGKTTLTHALLKLEPAHFAIESSHIISEVANAWQAQLVKPIKASQLDSINQWLKSLPDIIETVVHIKSSFEQLKISPQSLVERPVEFQKLYIHLENISLQPELLKQSIDSDNKELFRALLQWLGGYLVKNVDDGIWYKEILRRITLEVGKNTQLCLVSGLRYPKDAELLQEAGAVIINVFRPGHYQSDLLDPTERDRAKISYNCNVENNGSLLDLKNIAKTIYNDIHNSRLQKNYKTT